jgi:hypothetical protein
MGKKMMMRLISKLMRWDRSRRAGKRKRGEEEEEDEGGVRARWVVG